MIPARGPQTILVMYISVLQVPKRMYSGGDKQSRNSGGSAAMLNLQQVHAAGFRCAHRIFDLHHPHHPHSHLKLLTSAQVLSENLFVQIAWCKFACLCSIFIPKAMLQSMLSERGKCSRNTMIPQAMLQSMPSQRGKNSVGGEAKNANT